jgi:hypothetical protein
MTLLFADDDPVTLDALDAWLGATPGDGRHLGRIDKLSALD